VKRLVDENLSPTLVSMLSDLFPRSEHAYEGGLGGATDTRLWEYALRRGHHAGARALPSLAAVGHGSLLRRLSPRWTT